jgi:hypothetical protein
MSEKGRYYRNYRYYTSYTEDVSASLKFEILKKLARIRTAIFF